LKGDDLVTFAFSSIKKCVWDRFRTPNVRL